MPHWEHAMIVARQDTVTRSHAGFAGLAPAAVALLLGIVVLYGVGFAGAEVLHNAAHDSRHAFTFPCH
jgi:cobalt transporter subunit CbtB